MTCNECRNNIQKGSEDLYHVSIFCSLGNERDFISTSLTDASRPIHWWKVFKDLFSLDNGQSRLSNFFNKNALPPSPSIFSIELLIKILWEKKLIHQSVLLKQNNKLFYFIYFIFQSIQYIYLSFFSSSNIKFLANVFDAKRSNFPLFLCSNISCFVLKEASFSRSLNLRVASNFQGRLVPKISGPFF